MKEIRTTLRMEDEKIDVHYNGRDLHLNGKKVHPIRASLDTKRVVPFWFTVIVVILVVMVSMIVGSLFGRLDIAIISVSAGVAFGVVIFLALSRMEMYLQLECKEGQFDLIGPDGDLRALYYQISKSTIKKMKEKEARESSSVKRAGITRGENLFDEKELDSVRKDLKKSVVLGKRVVTQICPECGNDELYYEGGFMTGHVYHCKRCDYVGSFILEKELDLKEDQSS
jgi:predicted RNA-binding Zn-ribbon protein involved in translation (DUF1610 family)